MKATEVKYLALLDALAADPRATHAELASALDLPQSLANRYLRRLAAWGAVRVAGGRSRTYALTPKGDQLLRQTSWAFIAFFGGLLDRHRARTVAELRRRAGSLRSRKAALYGATPLAPILAAWAAEAGLEVVGVCDEERAARGVRRLDDLRRADLGCFIIADPAKAGDRVLAALLSQRAPVLDLFAADGRLAPEWRQS